MRRLFEFALKALISAALLYVVVVDTDLSVVRARLQDLRVEWMVAAVALYFIQLGLVSVRWRTIARACGATLAPERAFRLNLIATFFNQILPSTVGGDAVRVWLFSGRDASLSQATYSVVLDRLVGVLALAILVVVCLPWTLALVGDPVGRTALLVIGLGSIAGALAFVAFGYLRWHRLEAWAPVRHLIQMSRIARQVLFSAKTGSTVLALSLTVHVLAAGTGWCVAQAIAAPLGLFQALQLILPVMLIAMIPISIAGWGVREKTFVVAFAYAGLLESDGFLVSVLYGLTLLAVGVIGGIVWLTTSDRRRTSAESAAESRR